jgi:hypothetical protein
MPIEITFASKYCFALEELALGTLKPKGGGKKYGRGVFPQGAE